MIKTGGELHLPAMPACYLELWHRIVWPKVLKHYGGDNLKGSILDKKVISTNTELERIKSLAPRGAGWLSQKQQKLRNGALNLVRIIYEISTGA